MTSRELVEWKAYFQILAEESKKDELANKAKQGLEQRNTAKRRR